MIYVTLLISWVNNFVINQKVSRLIYLYICCRIVFLNYFFLVKIYDIYGQVFGQNKAKINS